MNNRVPSELPVKQGKMTKSPFQMSNKEYLEWQNRVKEKTKNYLFSIGQPLVYKKEGQYVAEYADGSIKVLE